MKRIAFRLRTLGTTAMFGSVLLGSGGLAGCSRSKATSFAESAPEPAVAAPVVDAKDEERTRSAAPSAPSGPAASAAPAAEVADLAAPRPAPTTAPARRAEGPGMSDDKAAHGMGFGVSPQFAGVKAGEWDDNANFREFQRFLASAPMGQRRMNLADRRFLVVRDKNGLGVPRCKVTIQDGKQTTTSFVTTASGRAILFPHAEGLSGDKLSATAACGEGTAETTFPLIDQEDGLVDLKLHKERSPIGTRAVDLAFVLDTTGSMAEEIAAVKTTIQKVAKSLSTEQTVIRIGLVEYKDRHDTFVTKVYPFATDLVGFAQRVSQISASGGGDTPEDMNAGLHAAITNLDWSTQAVARMAFVIADAPPHLDYADGPEYTTDMRTASHRGIQLFTVAASGMDGLGQVVFRQMAQYTGATNMFVLRGGAGPQSTGGGDPATSCGGTHTNYSSGKLDELIVQKIRHELNAVDADPMRIAGLRTDENAKPCDQRVVFKD